MTEERMNYGTSVPRTIEAFRNRPSALPSWHPGYKHPTPEEFKALVKLAGWSQRQAAMLAGVSYNEKGSTTIRKWQTEAGDERRRISYAAWRLLLAYAGVISIEDDLTALHAVTGGKYLDKCAEENEDGQD